MSDSPKIHLDDMQVSIRPEEIDSILSLRNTFDYFEVLGKYVTLYLEIGWVVKLVIPHLDVALDLDFTQVREVWNQGLTDLAIKGLHTCLMVYTGSASNLMVMEVHGKSAKKSLVLGRDWRAKCVIQVGEEWEQHFFTWPQALTLPNQTDLKTLDIRIFGEGGKVTLPPSLVPGNEAPIRWLLPPWETPPKPPPLRLMEFLKKHFPGQDIRKQGERPDIPSWEEILAHIAGHARLMKILLTPATEPEEYYRNLLEESRMMGLEDQNFLLGLLWHAPLGAKRHEHDSLQWFMDMIRGEGQKVIPEPFQVQNQLADLLKEMSRTLAEINKERESQLEDSFTTPNDFSTHPDNQGPEKSSWPTLPKTFPSERGPKEHAHPGQSHQLKNEGPSMGFNNTSIFPCSDIPVNRKQYEAMIYELGRLGAMQKFGNRAFRETHSLKAKLEAHREEEINHLRQLILEKKDRKWWRE